MKTHDKSLHTHVITILFVLFQFIQFFPSSLISSLTASAETADSVTLFSDESGSGTAKWSLSPDGKEITWDVTIDQNESETEKTPVVEVTVPSDVGAPKLCLPPETAHSLASDNRHIFSSHYSTTAQTLTLKFTTTVSDLTSPTLEFSIGSSIQEKDNPAAVELKSVSIPNKLAQLEAERIAAEKAEAERIAAEEKAEEERLAAEKAAQEEADRLAEEQRIADEKAEEERLVAEPTAEEEQIVEAVLEADEEDITVQEDVSENENTDNFQEGSQKTKEESEEAVVLEQDKETDLAKDSDGNELTEDESEQSDEVDTENENFGEPEDIEGVVEKEEQEFYIEGGKEIYTGGPRTTDGFIPVKKQPVVQPRSSLFELYWYCFNRLHDRF
ncbi:MAG: hypothetical protein U5K84_13575 [Alkalibacterium sp.]|nr:hypothetical protein [Alkalibacterium sp.]